MNYYSLPSLICAIFALLLGTVVFLKNPKSPVNRPFSLLCFETFNWQICWFLSYYLKTDLYGNLLVRISFTTIIFLPFTHYHFVVRFLNLKKKIMAVRYFYYIGSFWVILLWTTDKFMSGYQQFSWGIYGKAGSYYFIYLALVAVILIKTWIYLKKATVDTQRTAIARNQTKFVFFAIWLYFFAVPEYLINYGISIYPIGVFFILASFFIISYTIVKYRLMDIKLALKELLVFLSYVVVFSSIFFSLILLGRSSTLALVAITIVLISICPFAYHFLTAILEPVIVEKGFPGFKYLDEQKRFWQDVTRTPYTSGEVSWTLVQGEAEIMQIPKVSFLMWSKRHKGFAARAQTGLAEVLGTWLLPFIKLARHDPLIEWLTEKKEPIVKEELLTGENADSVKQSMEKINAEISIPLFEGSKLIGVLNLDKKPSGEIFHQDDIKWLKELAGAAQVHLTHTLFMENRASFSLGIAHDLKNLVRDLGLLAAELMEQTFSEEELAEKLKELALQIGFIGELQEAHYDLDEILARVLSDEYPYQAFDLVDIVKEIHTMMQTIAARKKLFFNLQIVSTLPLVIGNEKDIRRLLCNLLDNALKFTKQGGITIEIKSEEEKALIRISDTGPGIPEDKIEDVFEPFCQLHTETKEEGVGLGLSIVRQIVEANKGRIWVESKLGQGTNFLITLPLAPEEPNKILGG